MEAAAAALWIGVEIAVGVIVVMAADAVFGAFDVLTATATDPTVTFDFFLTDFPDLANLLDEAEEKKEEKR